MSKLAQNRVRWRHFVDILCFCWEIKEMMIVMVITLEVAIGVIDLYYILNLKLKDF